MKAILNISTLLLLIFCIISSCSKDDDYATPGELLGKELQQVINEYGVNRVECRNINGYTLTGSDGITNFEIKGETIKVGSNWYNLSFLARYTVDSHDTFVILNKKNKLILWFNFPQ